MEGEGCPQGVEMEGGLSAGSRDGGGGLSAGSRDGGGGGCPQGVEMEGEGCPQGVEMEGGAVGAEWSWVVGGSVSAFQLPVS